MSLEAEHTITPDENHYRPTGTLRCRVEFTAGDTAAERVVGTLSVLEDHHTGRWERQARSVEMAHVDGQNVKAARRREIVADALVTLPAITAKLRKTLAAEYLEEAKADIASKREAAIARADREAADLEKAAAAAARRIKSGPSS